MRTGPITVALSEVEPVKTALKVTMDWFRWFAQDEADRGPEPEWPVPKLVVLESLARTRGGTDESA